MAPHHVVILMLDDCVLLDVAIPVHVFGYHGDGLYRLTLAGPRRGPVRTSTGVVLHAEVGPRALATADTVVVPGYDEVLRPPPPAVLASLRAAAARGARVLSICTGAFALAYAGLLDGHRATTHWVAAAKLADHFPSVTVDPHVLYLDEGAVLTSAGVAAGLDLSRMRALDIDPEQRTAWAQTGLTAGEYTTATHAYGLATGFGDTASA